MKENIPEGWEKVKLKEILTEVSERNKGEKVKRVLSVTNSKGFVDQEEYFEGTVHSSDISNYKIIRKNQFAYNPSRVNVGSIDILKDYEEGALSPMYVIFKVDEKRLLPEYFKYYFQTHRFYENVKNNTQGSVRNSLSFKALASFEYLLPPIEEQQKIVVILEKVGKIINGVQSKIKYNKELKEEYICKIFKKDLNWQEESFENIFNILQNNSFKRSYLNYKNGKCKNIHYGDILTKYSEITNINESNVPYINTEIDINNYKKESFLKNGDIVIADTAEDEMVGKVTEIENVNIKVLSGLHTIACRPQKVFAKGYLGIYMNSKEYHNQLIPLMQGIKVLGINKSSIIKTKLKYPDIKKQENIVNIVRFYNEIIEKLNKKEDYYKEMKNALMQQLLTGKIRVNV